MGDQLYRLSLFANQRPRLPGVGLPGAEGVTSRLTFSHQHVVNRTSSREHRREWFMQLCLKSVVRGNTFLLQTAQSPTPSCASAINLLQTKQAFVDL